MSRYSKDVLKDIVRIANNKRLSEFERCEKIHSIFKYGFYGKELMERFSKEYETIYNVLKEHNVRQLQNVTLVCISEFIANGKLHTLSPQVYQNVTGQTCPEGLADQLLESIKELFSEDKQQFIEKAVEKYTDTFDYTNSVYVRPTIQMSIDCKRCNTTFYQTPHAHLNASYPCISCAVTIDGWEPPDNEKKSENYAHVFNGLWISDIWGAQNVSWVQSRDFGGIVDLSNSPIPIKFSNRHEVLRISVDDNAHANLKPYFERTAKFIDSHLTQGRNVLVFCRAGISRSASIVINYLVATFSISVEDALKYLKKKRPHVQPNQGFMKQLIENQNND